TGHLVFSTLHTNDAVGAVTRLLDLGVKPFLVAASLHGVVAQRLVRKTCEKCRRSHGASAAELEVLQLPSSVPAPLTVFRGQGCGACDRSGYRGRLGVFEVLVVDDALRRLVHERASVAALRRCARAGGLRTMREDGVHKVIAGLTTVEEVVSITLADSLPQ
ncbi:MAG TPA: ATPase, T2SS/T4P/T4SS family, partial [Opitutus sp.]|nr:ATPase, T2SS/T4P/T4SS family [Opitutus sp.]